MARNKLKKNEDIENIKRTAKHGSEQDASRQRMTQIDGRRGAGKNVEEGNDEYRKTVRCNSVRNFDRTKKNDGGKSYCLSIFRLFFLSMPVTEPSGHWASLQSRCTRSDKSGQRKTVLGEDKGTHLWGFAAKHRLFASTKPRRGAQATVASDSVMASFQGRQGHEERDGTLPRQNNTHICKQRPPYGEQNILHAFAVFLARASPQGRPETEMAPCQTQTRRHSQAPSEAV